MPATPPETAEELLYVDQDHPLAGFTFDRGLGCHQSPPPQRLLVSLPASLRPADLRRGMLLAVHLGWTAVQGKRWRHVQVLRVAAPAGDRPDSVPTGPRAGAEPTSFSVMLARAPRTDRPGGARGAVGRKVLVAGEATEAHSITLPASVWRRVEELGDGNRSEGVRRLAEAHRAVVDEGPLRLDGNRLPVDARVGGETPANGGEVHKCLCRSQGKDPDCVEL